MKAAAQELGEPHRVITGDASERSVLADARERAESLAHHGAERPLPVAGAHRESGCGLRGQQVASGDWRIRRIDLAADLSHERNRPASGSPLPFVEDDAGPVLAGARNHAGDTLVVRGTARHDSPCFVEDDDDYREAVSGELADYGFDVATFCDGGALLASLAAGLDAEIIVLDWSLPSVSGIDLLPRLRRNGIGLPVVFLTGRSLPAYEKLAFDRGALDFVDKSRGVPILAHRLRLIAESAKKPACRFR